MKPDPSTLSTYTKVAVKATKLDLTIDWTNSTLFGSVQFRLSEIRSRQLTLDTSWLNIRKVKFDGNAVKFDLLSRTKALGSPLQIDLPECTQGTLNIEFSTTDRCTALQWLKPGQTTGKKAPYLFSQCQPIHARSLFPCFDTPCVKSVFDIVIRSKYPTVATGIPVSSEDGIYTFRQDIAISSYLIAIASGDITSLPIGPRSRVWAEPQDVKSCQYEFENDTEKFIQSAEKIVFPYEWKSYDILVLPPSFPFGGMENPNITFATPTLISGDRQLVDVIAHELAHSWSGNLVTNSSWEHFWLNEGWTVYLERRILGALHGEKYRDFESIIGWQELEESIKSMGDSAARFSPLVVDLSGGVDPDDAFSTVPYEKGSTFLRYLETLLGRESWDKFIPFYFQKFKQQSLDTDMFVETLYEFFRDKKHVLDGVDWKLWLEAPGLPPKPDFDESIAKHCYDLSDQWATAAETGDFSFAAKSNVEDWTALQLVVFFDALALQLSTQKHLSEAVMTLGKVYEIASTRNCEVKARWFKLAVTAGIREECYRLADWIGTVGRMKFVRPGYRQLAKYDRKLAVDTFRKHESFYHTICRAMVMKDLNIE